MHVFSYNQTSSNWLHNNKNILYVIRYDDDVCTHFEHDLNNI